MYHYDYYKTIWRRELDDLIPQRRKAEVSIILQPKIQYISYNIYVLFHFLQQTYNFQAWVWLSKLSMTNNPILAI